MFDELLEALNAGADMFVILAGRIWQIYSSGGIFAIPITIWILDRLFGIFDILKP